MDVELKRCELQARKNLLMQQLIKVIKELHTYTGTEIMLLGVLESNVE